MQINYNLASVSQADQKNATSNKQENTQTDPQNRGIKGETLEIKTSKGPVPAGMSFENNVKNDDLSEIFDKIISAETEEEKFDMLTGTLLSKGGKIDSTPENRNIVAFRNPNLPTENKKRGIYDDTTFVFWKEKDGTKRVKDFLSNTDPNGLFTDSRPNGDFGRIMAGKTYTFNFSYSQKLGKSLMPSAKLNIERFDPKENNFKPAKTTLDEDKTFLFHDGLESYNNTFSMGCQTFPRIYDSKNKTWNFEFNNFWEAMRGDESSRQKQINYTILQFEQD